MYSVIPPSIYPKIDYRTTDHLGQQSRFVFPDIHITPQSESIHLYKEWPVTLSPRLFACASTPNRLESYRNKLGNVVAPCMRPRVVLSLLLPAVLLAPKRIVWRTELHARPVVRPKSLHDVLFADTGHLSTLRSCEADAAVRSDGTKVLTL